MENQSTAPVAQKVERTRLGLVHEFLTSKGATEFRLKEEAIGRTSGKAYQSAYAKCADGSFVNFVLSAKLREQLASGSIEPSALNACEIVSTPGTNPNTGELTVNYFIQRPEGTASIAVALDATAAYTPKAIQATGTKKSMADIMALLANAGA